ncbi:MAG: kinase/pyrophosphorylase, partial [Actinobacteria bacterium]
SRGQLEGVVRGATGDDCVFLYTLADTRLRDVMHRVTLEKDIMAIDIMGPVVGALAGAIHRDPAWKAGAVRTTGAEYFERVDALDFAVQHDDGRNAEELDQADIVLIGVSRSSKTPLSMYLAFKGYKVANVPLVPGVEPPPELFAVDRSRLFGLVIDAGTLSEIRRQRIGDLGPYSGGYADIGHVEDELADSRALMRRLGCFVVNTGSRAIEETAQEILRHFECALPRQGAAQVEQVPETFHARRAPRRRLPRPGD